MGFEPVLFVWPPLRLAWIERLSSYRSVSFFPLVLPLSVNHACGGEVVALTRWVGRAIGLDVHRDFCVVAICEDGNVRSAGRVPSTPEGLAALTESLLATDRVAWG